MSDNQNGNSGGGIANFLQKLQSGEISGTISLKSYKGNYLSVMPKEGDVSWDQNQIGETEQFKVEPQGGNNAALKSSQGLYLSAKDEIGGTVRCDQAEVLKSAIWAVEEAGDGIALKSCFGKYLHPKKNGEVTATHDAVTEKETFTVTLHS
jgi:putative lipoic acid-binding regulatory protein